MSPKIGVLLAIACAFGCTNTVERIVYVTVNDAGANDSGADAGAQDAGSDAGSADSGTGDGGTFTQVASIALTPSAATMQVGDALIISATINAIGGGTLTSVLPVWSSTNSTIASVDQSGNVTANGLGEVDIAASAEGVSGTAHITVVSHTVALSVSIVGSGGVSGPGGFTCSTGTCSANFAPGSVVLTATPASGFEFAGWSGAGCSGILPCSVALSAAASVTATFTAEPVLTVSISGAGSVSSTPAGIACSGAGGSCSAAFPAGTAIVLTETPGSGLEFGAWAGACAGTSTTCSLVLDTSKSASAAFGHFHSLSVSVTGHGAVSAGSGAVQGCSASGGTCSGTYAAGAQVTLTATPAPGAAFSAWTGACASATSTVCTVTMSSDQSASATFTDAIAVSAASGDGQSAIIDAPLALPVIIHVTNASSGADVQGSAVTLHGPPGAAIAPASATTDSQGRASFNVRLARTIGTQTFTATTAAGAPLTITATATAPSTNMVFTLVDASHNPGFDGIPGPATTAHLTTPTGLALAADGTLYIADFSLNTVFALSPAGVLTLIAGNGGCGSGGDGGAALSAQLCHPCDLALDERSGARTLYVADFGNNRIRAIDLTLPSPQISTLTGAGGAPDPGDGDGGPASQASLVNPARMSLGPDGMLYIADQGRNRIRRVNLTALTIDNWIAGDSSFCRYNTCAVSWDAAGTAFLTRNISYAEFDVLRVGANLSLTEVAGGFNQSSYAYGDDIPATQAHLWAPAPVRFDGAGNLILTETSVVSPGGHDVRRMSELTNRLTTLTGDGTPAYAGDYVDASQARFNSPWTSVLDASGNLYISDTSNSAVRVLWGAGQSTPASATLTKTAGDLQTVGVDQLTSTMSVSMHDGAGQAIVGFPVTWASLDPGAVINAGTVATDNSGDASADGRVGLAVSSTFRFTATAYDFHGAPIAGSPVTFTHTSTELATGYFFSPLNIAHTQGYAGIPGSATAALSPAPVALAYAADGTLYYATSDNIDTALFALSPAGVVTRLSGNTSCGYAGDTGPASDAQLCNLTDLVLDETHGRRTLYFTDATHFVVRAIDLTATPPIIYRVAGGGGATTSPYGDGGLATEATISHSEHITLDPTGDSLYVSSYDGTSTWIRRVNLSTGLIDTWIPPAAMPGGGASCAQSACKFAFSPDGTAVMVAGLGSYVFQLFTFDPAAVPTPAYTRIAGMYDRFQLTGDGAALGQYFMPGDLRFGPDGKLYLTDPFSMRVRVMSDLTTSATMSTVAGYATQTGSNGPDGPSAFVGLNFPHAVAFAPNGSIVIADTSNDTLREIWRAIP